MGAISVTPRSLPSPAGQAGAGAPRVWSRWEMFLGSIRAGTKLEDAMLEHLIKRDDIETACLQPDGLQAFLDATKAAQRRAWSVLDIQEVFSRIRNGDKVKDAINAVKPGNTTFLDVVLEDKALETQYLSALKSRAVLLADDLEDWAAEDKDDILENGKGGQTGNNAAVARDKLRVETRLKLMASWFPKLFNDRQVPQTQVNVQINHAARLEEARARAQSRRVVLPAEPERGDPAAYLAPAEILEGELVVTTKKEDWQDTSWLEK